MLKKILLSLATLLSLSEAQLLGSSKDSHECVTDGGYSWCPTLGKCVREWETPCNKNAHIVPCHSKNAQFGKSSDLLLHGSSWISISMYPENQKC